MIESPLCAGQEETIYRYLDGDLSSQEAVVFRTHLAECVACQSLLAEVERLFTGLENLNPIAMSDEAIAHASNTIMAEIGASPQREAYFYPGWPLMLVQLLVGLGLFIILAPTLLAQYQSAWSALSIIDWATTWQSWQHNWATFIAFLGQWQQLQPTSWSLNFMEFTLSLEMAAVIGLVLGFAWLISNTVLLGRKPTLFEEGGRS